MDESKPASYYGPQSNYYLERTWEEYHKLKEELADTKSKLAQAEDEIDRWKRQWVSANAENIKLREQKNYGGLHTDGDGVTIRADTWEDVRARCS